MYEKALTKAANHMPVLGLWGSWRRGVRPGRELQLWRFTEFPRLRAACQPIRLIWRHAKSLKGGGVVLRDLELRPDYRSGRDALLDEFYVPCLQESVRYDRAVGYFSSTILQVVALAYSDFVRRGGRIRLICSPALSIADFDAMKEGTDLSGRAQECVRADLDDLINNPEAMPATRLLATLIANDIADVRIAFADHPDGIFHDKLGIFEDIDARRVSFVGSANETFRAWGLNHESFEVFCSWRDESELYRTRNHSDAFTRLWSGIEPGVTVQEVDQVTRDKLLDIADSDLDHAIEAARVLYQGANRSTGLQRELMSYQDAVLKSWEDNNYRGIVNFATGAGKTITAIEGMRRWSERGGKSVVLVPGRDLHIQWIKEIRDVLPAAEILPAGADNDRRDWESLLSAFTAPGDRSDPPRIVVTTNKTFALQDFLRRLSVGDHLLIVADEMHRAGSSRTLNALEATYCGATLGLSATYNRQFDSTGTARLLAYFGPVLEPVIGLADALAMKRLVPYDYRLHALVPDEDEIEEYGKLTLQIARVADDEGSQERIRMLLIQRARIFKKARCKVPAAVEILTREYETGDRWLVYCDDKDQLGQVTAECLQSGLPVMEFYSGMPSDRDVVLKSLGEFGGIVVAIRCLDEGIDIPVTDHALILASSTVEREYVQRRGRVLRTSPGKVSAEIHDLILVDSRGGALTKGEAVRALEFARLARNEAARERLKAMIALSSDPVLLPPDFNDDEEENENGG